MNREQLIAHVTALFGDKFKPLESERSDPMFELVPADLLEVTQKLRDDETLRFDFLCNLAGVDRGEYLEVVYSVASIANNLRLDFKLKLTYDKPTVESIQSIWPGANWYEREMWELYGIDILNHNNLKRFLLPDDWDQGNPMRKNWDAPDFIRMPEL